MRITPDFPATMVVNGQSYRKVEADELIEPGDRLWVRFDPDGIIPTGFWGCGVSEPGATTRAGIIGRSRSEWVQDDNHMYEVWRPFPDGETKMEDTAKVRTLRRDIQPNQLVDEEVTLHVCHALETSELIKDLAVTKPIVQTIGHAEHSAVNSLLEEGIRRRVEELKDEYVLIAGTAGAVEWAAICAGACYVRLREARDVTGELLLIVDCDPDDLESICEAVEEVRYAGVRIHITNLRSAVFTLDVLYSRIRWERLLYFFGVDTIRTVRF